MKWSEYAIAKVYFQLLAEADQRVLEDREVRLLKTLTPTIDRYEARETAQLKTSGAAG